MKVFLPYTFLIILFLVDKIKSQRRIINGKKISGTPKRYMAYLLRAPLSPKKYDAWVCGGAIVNPLFIITSAACVEDIEYMYAITGYEKYVPSSKMNDDECVKKTKKKVVFTCTPKMYELDHAKIEKWSNVDIAAVKVESPYQFHLLRPQSMPYCTWVPDQIEISFETKHQAPETDVMVLGWGHSTVWRKPTDNKDYNQEILQYSPTLILDKTLCKNVYKSAHSELPKIIDKYMICTLGEGNIDADGRIINRSPANLDGCGKLDGDKNNDCIPKTDVGSSNPFSNFNYYGLLRRSNREFNKSESEGPQFTRRNGICQNDHGGPLITWVGGREMLIGVASVFLVNAKDRTCTGPYLHTSTQCSSAFLNCVLKMFDEAPVDAIYKNSSRRFYQQESPEMAQERRNREDMNQRYRYMVMMNGGLCDLPPQERGFDMIQRRISWLHHPDGFLSQIIEYVVPVVVEQCARVFSLRETSVGHRHCRRLTPFPHHSMPQEPTRPAENEIPDELIERPQIPLNIFS